MTGEGPPDWATTTFLGLATSGLLSDVWPPRCARPFGDRRESPGHSSAFEARELIEPPASHGPMISWAGPPTQVGTPAPMDGWSHAGDGALKLRQISSQERGTSAAGAGRDPDVNVRRSTGESVRSRRSDGRLALRSTAFRGVGGVLLLTSAFMDGRSPCLRVSVVDVGSIPAQEN